MYGRNSEIFIGDLRLRSSKGNGYVQFEKSVCDLKHQDMRMVVLMAD